MAFLKERVRNLIEYTGTGDWIYTRRILAWVREPEMVRQLPLGMRIFSSYIRFYIRAIGTETVLFGHGFYKILRLLDRKPARGPAKLDICGQSVWLDLSDPGSLWAIQELSTGSTLSSLIQSLAGNADVFVDVGANQGIFTAVASRTIRADAKIIAIEPQPSLATCIENTLRLSKARHWSVVRKAVADSPGTLNLVIPEENFGEAHLQSNASPPETTVNIEVTTLDEILVDASADQNIVVKMDIEGGEIAALLGGKEFFTRCAPVLIMELNPEAMRRYGYNAADIAEVLTDLGYQNWAHLDCMGSKRPLRELPDIYCDVILFSPKGAHE